MNHDVPVRLFDILRVRGVLTSSAQKIVLGFMSRWGVDAYRALVETHLVEESRLADILADELKIPRMTRLRSLQPKCDILNMIPYDLALELAVFPFDISGHDDRLCVVMADPSNGATIQMAQAITKKSLELFVGERSEIIAAIQNHYPLSMQLPSMFLSRQSHHHTQENVE